ncbi:MAG TPA: lysophospholipid acyltransferase family protein [Gallionella sp.]
MTPYLFKLVFRLIAALPLRWLHSLGALLGRLDYLFSASHASRTRENLIQSGVSVSAEQFSALLRQSIDEAGKGMIELPWVWLRPAEEVLEHIVECQGWELVEAAHARGKGLVILTPHIGCFEVIGLYVGARMAMTCLYRVPKQAWMDDVIRRGRERGMMKLARADVGGVRVLLKALKRGEVIGILPDQVPGNGEGEWLPFFGRPAYTMTLVSRLLEASDASVLMCFAERLPKGRGYSIKFSPLELQHGLPVTPQINHAVEMSVRSCPAQYLWSYNRYKVPAGVAPPEPHNKGESC